MFAAGGDAHEKPVGHEHNMRGWREGYSAAHAKADLLPKQASSNGTHMLGKALSNSPPGHQDCYWQYWRAEGCMVIANPLWHSHRLACMHTTENLAFCGTFNKMKQGQGDS